jgi:general secretion pathway protein B
MLLVAAASLVTGTATWYLLLGNGAKSVAAVRTAVPPPAASVKPPAVIPAVPLPVQSQSAPVAPPTVSPSAPAPAAPENRATAGGGEASPREVRRSKRQIKSQSPSTYPKQTVQTVQAPADIKLSGIAWQDERAARRVVINGFLLKEGAVVTGAKIIDIQADRVRFSSAAGQFEIKLDAVMPTEVKR